MTYEQIQKSLAYLDKLELDVRHLKLLLDRQFINPFVRMDSHEVEKVKNEVKVHF